MATVIAFRNEPHRRFFQVVLDSAETVILRLDADGILIERLDGKAGVATVLFRGGADQAARIAHGLLGGKQARPEAALDVFLAAVVNLRSAENVRRAFAAAVAAIS